jgi:hypothetical protein
MTNDLDQAVRSAVADIVAAAPEPGLTPQDTFTQPPRSHRQAWLSAAAAAIAIAGVGAIALATTSDDPETPPAVADSIAPTPPGETDPTPSTLSEQPATTSPEEPVAEARPLGLIEFQDWVGKYNLDYQNGTVLLGTTGTVTYTLETASSLSCLVASIDDEDISGTCAASDGSLAPLGSSPLAGSARTQPGLWYAIEVLPSDIDQVELLHNGAPACRMERFSLQHLGNADLWACESDGTKPAPLELSVTRGTETVTTNSKIAPCPQGQSCTYVIETGDYPYLVAEKLCTTITELVAANGWASANDLPHPGVEIAIPNIPDATACPRPAD